MLFVQNRDVKLALQTRSLALLVALSVAATSSVVASAEGAKRHRIRKRARADDD